MTSLKLIIDTYNARGFKVKAIQMPQKNLECKGIILNITARYEHVQEVERYIHTTKECKQQLTHTFWNYSTLINRLDYIQHCLLAHLLPTQKWHTPNIKLQDNYDRISYDKHCKIPFRTYVQVHEQHNSLMLPSGAITLRQSRNARRSYYLLNLY